MSQQEANKPFTDHIANALNLDEPLDIVQVKKDAIAKRIVEQEVAKQEPPEPAENVADNDLDVARRNLKNMIGKIEESLEGLLDLAMQSDSPKAYESVALLAKAGIEASEKLVQLHKIRGETRRLDGEPSENSGSGPKQITQQAIFVGSTRELLDMMKQKQLPES